MPNNEREFPGGIMPGGWTPTPERLRRWDARQAESVDGESGNIVPYAPARPIIIGGEGLIAQGAASVFSGKVYTGRAGQIFTPANTKPAFYTARNRPVLIHIAALIENDVAYGEMFEHQQSAPFGMKGIATSAGVNPNLVSLPLPQLRMHNQATLARVRYRYRMGTRLTTTQLKDTGGGEAFKIPRLRVKTGYTGPELYVLPAWVASSGYQVDDVVHSTGGGGWGGSNGYSYRCTVAGTTGAGAPAWSTVIGNNTVDSSVTWRTEVGFANPNNHYALAPMSLLASSDDFYAAGSVKEIVFTPNQNAVINTDLYTYQAEIQDFGRGDIHHSLLFEFEGIADLRET